ncbi:DUF1499 domain-containing protein [Actimicrobium sp. CCC2.4]|uniref:DUF1499 domain-containing protein n=1 Tax=Actimicrobium sp. CCC2.4 TaxID=3048606 RepID=UPI002AC9D9D8|nr:DUF1499 domain-containing protein [Actimicrobium sp. CCC2.4]MEB0135700.1 DUF1499 domain-containing protein [Actimicrobium sp. CCC2.4]WPX33742.1 DUF1499 domain-containing protein [Actimicrobium sp. CCC2.4]
MKISRIPLLLALLSLVLLGASGIGVQLGWWAFPVGFQMLRWVVYCGVAAVVVSLICMVAPAWRRGSWTLLLLGLLIGAGSAFVPWQMAQQAQTLPRIHDISTDLIDPPAFVAILPLRADAVNPAAYGGPGIAAEQRRGYPDIVPLTLTVMPADAYVRALAAVKKMGWEIVADDAAGGRIEATATTRWFGFKDDVVVRVLPAVGGSRIDVRSVSRVGKSDVGTNARRIRRFIAAINMP